MAKISKKKLKKGNRSKLERKLDEVNHTMERRMPSAGGKIIAEGNP
jgi:hypothetical protein